MPEIRRADLSDVDDMVRLIESARLMRQEFRPVFWRLSEDSAEKTKDWFSSLVGSDDAVCLVAIVECQLRGFVIATKTPAPPVYDPGGSTWTVDDFAVSEEGEWKTLGKKLLESVVQALKDRDARQLVGVSAHSDEGRTKVFESLGLEATSVWFTRTL